MAHWQVVNSRPNFLSFLGLYEGRLKKYWHLDFIFCIVIKSHWRVLLSGSHNMFNPLKLQEDHILTLCNVKSGIKMEHVNSFNLSMLILFCFAFRLENSSPSSQPCLPQVDLGPSTRAYHTFIFRYLDIYWAVSSSHLFNHAGSPIQNFQSSSYIQQ